MASQRLQWMDLIRGICILLVIFLHASAVVIPAAPDYPAAFTAINEFLDPFRIPLLMFLSGMLLHKSLAKAARPYVLGKFYLIFWPFLLWSMVTYAAEGRLTLEWILKTPISAPSVLWYLWFLCAFYLLALPLERWRVPLLPVIALSLVASEILPSFLRMDRFAALFVFFLLGHYVAKNALTARVPVWLGLAGLAAALTGATLSATQGPIKYDALYIWVPFGLIAFLLWASRFYRPTAAGGPVEWIGRNSIVFYAAHFPVLVASGPILAELLTGTAAGRNGVVFFLLLFGWALLVGAALQMLRARWRAVAALFDFRNIPGPWASAPATASPRP